MPISTRTPRVPNYRRHKPTGQAVVTLNGKDHYLGRWNTAASRYEYQRLLGEWLTGGCPSSTETDARTSGRARVIENILSYRATGTGFGMSSGTSGPGRAGPCQTLPPKVVM